MGKTGTGVLRFEPLTHLLVFLDFFTDLRVHNGLGYGSEAQKKKKERTNAMT